MAISGMYVALNTFDSSDAGTDDEIYLGLFGTAGGREFPLSSPDHDDFERGKQDMYILGVDPDFGFTALRPSRSKPGQPNDPALVPLDLNSIQYVYLRKQAYGSGESDNAWRLHSCVVLIYEQQHVPLNQPRTFSVFPPDGQWLGNEHGHQVWLREYRGRDARELLAGHRLDTKVHLTAE